MERRFLGEHSTPQCPAIDTPEHHLAVDCLVSSAEDQMTYRRDGEGNKLASARQEGYVRQMESTSPPLRDCEISKADLLAYRAKTPYAPCRFGRGSNP